MINLADFETVDTGTMTVLNPDGDPMTYDANGVEKTATITYHAPGSSGYIKAETKRTNRQLKRQRAGTKLTADELRADQVEFLVAVTAGQEGFGDAALAPGDVMRTIYENRRVGFIADQGTAFLNDWSHFKKTSGKS